jgi:Acetyltransferase (GNAT) family
MALFVYLTKISIGGKCMLEMNKIQKGIHNCFDEDLDHSFSISENGEIIGYVRFTESQKENGAWVEYILAKKRGEGYGEKMIRYLFDSYPFEYLDGTSIYEPHHFWKRIGAEFSDEVDEDACDGTYFKLNRDNFYKAIQN